MDNPVGLWDTSSKLGNSYINRFSIDEDDACEIVGIYNISDKQYINKNAVIRAGIRSLAKISPMSKFDQSHLIFVGGLTDISLRQKIALELSLFRIYYTNVTILKMTRMTLVTEKDMELSIKRLKKGSNVDLISRTISEDVEFFYKTCTGEMTARCQLIQFDELTINELELWEELGEEYLRKFKQFSPGNFYLHGLVKSAGKKYAKTLLERSTFFIEYPASEIKELPTPLFDLRSVNKNTIDPQPERTSSFVKQSPIWINLRLKLINFRISNLNVFTVSPSFSNNRKTS